MTKLASDIALKTIDGTETTLREYQGKVLLVVNVASKCGLTPQYTGLQALYEQYAGQGLEILGFPSNDFAGQEPGTEAEIADFCSTTYDVTFPLFSKMKVTGPDKHPLYSALTEAVAETTGEGPMRAKLAAYGLPDSDAGEVLWNFEKFLIGADGTILERFAPDLAPDDTRLREAIEAALKA